MEILGPDLYPELYDRTNTFGVTQVSPAAGADVAITVPNGVLWQVRALRALLTASANAANRNVGFIVKNQDGTTVWDYNCTSPLTAGLTLTVTFSPTCSLVPTTVATTNHLLFPAPSFLIPAEWTFGTSTLNIDGSDQWSAVRLWVVEWLPPDGD